MLFLKDDAAFFFSLSSSRKSVYIFCEFVIKSHPRLDFIFTVMIFITVQGLPEYYSIAF